MQTAATLSRICLRIFVVMIVMMALLGAAAIATPWGSWHVHLRIFLTVLTIAVGSVGGLACGGCLQRGHKVLPSIGLVLSAIACAMILVGIWVEMLDDLYWKTTWTITCFAVACAHLAMLFMMNLAGRYRWAYAIAYQLIFGLAALMTLAVIFDWFNVDAYTRLTGVVAVLVAAITILIPVFHFLSREVIAQQLSEADPLLAVENEIAHLRNRLAELEQRREALKSQNTN